MNFNEALDEIFEKIGEYPSPIVRKSYLFELEKTFTPQGTLIDIGGGVSIKNAVLSKLGMKVIVFDLFETYYDNAPSGIYDIKSRKSVCIESGVELRDVDIFKVNLVNEIGAESSDIVTSIHVFEHFHRSPRHIVEQAMSILKHGGRLHIEVPNATNLRKRIDVFRGRTNYPDFVQFYEKTIWNGHIREYTVGDLKIMGEKTGNPFFIYGRNYFGGAMERLPVWVQPIIDHTLRPFPGLCGSLFLDVVKR